MTEWKQTLPSPTWCLGRFSFTPTAQLADLGIISHSSRDARILQSLSYALQSL